MTNHEKCMLWLLARKKITLAHVRGTIKTSDYLLRASVCTKNADFYHTRYRKEAWD